MNVAMPFEESGTVGTLPHFGEGWATLAGSDASLTSHGSYKAAVAQAKAIIRQSLAGAVVFSELAKAALDRELRELAEQQSDATKKRIAAQTAAEKRLEVLKEIAAEEGFAVSPGSEKALKAFLAATSFTKRPYITLLDNGNVRVFWEDKATGEQVGLQFLGGDQVQYVIFARRGRQGYIARSAGRDLVTNMESQIDANGLRRLMA